MTNTNWRKLFEQEWFVKNGELSPESYLKMMNFIQSTLDSALQDQKDELLEKIEKRKHKTFKYMANPTVSADFTSVGGMKITAGVPYENTSSLSENEILDNDCLEIIKGLIKGE